MYVTRSIFTNEFANAPFFTSAARILNTLVPHVAPTLQVFLLHETRELGSHICNSEEHTLQAVATLCYNEILPTIRVIFNISYIA